MNEALLLMGSVVMICILMNRVLEKIAVPSLLIFLALGMCFGENGLLKIYFNDYEAVNLICSASLIFIMFYGGFGTNLKEARTVLVPSVVLSTLGVAGTAGLVALFVHYVLQLPWLESLLIGSVISSTDAASVFNILRSKKLALKYHTDSLLELESGSNDPISYMLTTVTLTLMTGQEISVPVLLAKQLLIGVGCGVAMGVVAVSLLKRSILATQQSRTVFLFSVMLLAYGLPCMIQGNGYLSVYLCGIWIGNSNLPQKRYLVHFFDVVTDVAQVMIFFLLGLLVTPVELPMVLLPALMIMLFLTFVARPVVSGFLLLPFRPSMGQIGVVSWAGLRGAASIVFAISAVLSQVETTYNLYNLVFCIVLFSISIQGTLLPHISKLLHMIDVSADVGKTFTDYQEESDIHFVKIHLGEGHPWCGQSLKEIGLPSDLLVAMIARSGGMIVPHGDTRLEQGDLLVLAARAFEDRDHMTLSEITIERGHKWANHTLATLPQTDGQLVILIKRGMETMIPTGSSWILPNDNLVIARTQEEKT